MNAYTIISALTMAKATSDKLETATSVLASLEEMKTKKGMPMLAIRRAIRMQKKIVSGLVLLL